MNKKVIVPLVAVIVLLLAGVAYLGYNLNEQKQANKDMQELAALDKKEMENEYQQFANQYKEMQTRINNDSIVEQLGREQQRTQELLEELRRTKANDAAEITRLKKELATVRAILRSYVLQIDSLNQLNAELMDENNRVRSELAESNQQNMQLTSNNMTLSEKVAIASQLNAASINVIILRPINSVIAYEVSNHISVRANTHYCTMCSCPASFTNLPIYYAVITISMSNCKPSNYK